MTMMKTYPILILGVACVLGFAAEHSGKAADKPTPKKDSVPEASDNRGFFIACGNHNGKEPDGKLREGETGIISVSTDGEHWEQVFKGGMQKDNFNHSDNNWIASMAYGRGRFVAVGHKGIGSMYSEDGRKWVQGSKFGDGVEMAPGGFAFGNDMFVIANAGGFMVSKDGIRWDKRTSYQAIEKLHGVSIWDPKGPGHIRDMVFGNGVFVAWGERRFGTTKDAKTYVHHELLGGINSIVYGGGRFIMLNTWFGHKTSKDGIEWKPLVIDSDDRELIRTQGSGIWDGEEFVISGRSCLYHSKDGEEWKKTVVKKGNASLKGGGQGLLIGSTNTTGFTLSKDGGKTWVVVPSEFWDWGTRIQWFESK